MDGNALTVEEQNAKLRLVVEVARDVSRLTEAASRSGLIIARAGGAIGAEISGFTLASILCANLGGAEIEADS